MKTQRGSRLSRYRVFALVSVAAIFACVAQHAVGGEFQNLDFEEATAWPPGEWSTLSEALPHWAAGCEYGVPYVAYNAATLDAPSVSIHDPFSQRAPCLNGWYSVELLTEYDSRDPYHPPVYISQIGDIPATAHSLWFDSVLKLSDGTWDLRSNLVVSLNGTVIPMHPQSEFSTSWLSYDVDCVEYAGDVSAFAGQKNVELRFSVSALPDRNRGQAILDDIAFSTSRVTPEPSTFALLIVGAVSVLGYSWRWKRRWNVADL